MSVTPEELQAQKPVVISVSAQEIGVLWTTKTSPFEYLQYVLQKLRNAGAPIEGTLRLKPAYGQVVKLKQSANGPGQFDFVWVPPAWIQAMNEHGGIMGDVDPRGVKLEVKG